jgi:hypothetical protein
MQLARELVREGLWKHLPLTSPLVSPAEAFLQAVCAAVAKRGRGDYFFIPPAHSESVELAMRCCASIAGGDGTESGNSEVVMEAVDGGRAQVQDYI